MNDLKVSKVIVTCLDYNGHKNVLFMMKTDDPRYGNGYQHLTTGKHVAKEKMFVGDNGVVYNVFADWSVKAV